MILESKHKNKSDSATIALLEVEYNPIEVDTKPLLQVFLVNTQWVKAMENEQETEKQAGEGLKILQAGNKNRLKGLSTEEKEVYWFLRVFTTRSVLWLMVTKIRQLVGIAWDP